MQLTKQHQKQVIYGYCILFYVLMCWKFLNGLFLYQAKPHLFNNRFDLLTWLLMETNIHQWLLNNPIGWIVFDAVFYVMPLLFLVAYEVNTVLSRVVAVIMLAVNFTYIQCYTLYPLASIEGFIAWLLFPFLFITTNLRSFYFILHTLRYFFLFFFVSAGIWKFVQGGILNIDQMSGVLLLQHKEYLTSSPGSWYSYFIYWLVQHTLVSYLLYLAATLFELSFITGFFTKKWDYWLIATTLVFLLSDLFFMRIAYWEVSPFLIALLFSKYTLPTFEPKGSIR